jgi:hypothetical protein
MKIIARTILSFLMIFAFFSCESDYGPFNRDNRPDVPLLFTNATTYGFDPYIEVSESGDGQIEFVMEIPEETGRTISQISGVAAGSTAINPGTLKSNDEDYIDAPVSGEGNTVTFRTSLAEFKVKRPAVTITIPKDGFAEIAFIFLVTLDNGDEIISQRSRVRVSQ